MPFDAIPLPLPRPAAAPWRAPAYLSDDLDELHAAAERVRAKWLAADADITLADEAEDTAAYERACAEFDRHDRELALTLRRIDELEEDEAFEARREERRDFWRAVLWR